MKRITFLFVIISIAISSGFAQIKLEREYDYVGSETNAAGLRVVGIKDYIRDTYYPNTAYYRSAAYIDGYGCIDKSGNEVVPLIYAEIKTSKEWDFIVVKKLNISNNRVDRYDYGILSEDGQKTIAPIKYKQISNIKLKPNTKEMQYAIVMTHKGLLGFINNRGEEIVPPIYHKIEQRDRDYFKVQQNGKWGLLLCKGNINCQFQEIVPPKYDDLYLADNYNYCFAVLKNEVWGVIDYKGNEIISPQYAKFHGGARDVLIAKKGIYSYEGWGVIDINNNVIVPFEYDDIFNFNGWSMWAEKEIKGKTYYTLLDRNGNILLPPKRDQPYLFNYHHSVNEGHIQCFFKNGHFDYYADNGKKCKTEDEAKLINKALRDNYDAEHRKKEVDEKTLPIIDWSDFETTSTAQDYQLKICIKSDLKIEDVTITINGTQEKGIKTVNSSDYDLTINRTLTLNEGTNIVKVSVTNAAGTTQEERTIVYRPQGGELPIIEWLDFASTANKKEYLIKLGVKSKTKVEEVNVTVNGALTRGIKTVQTDDYDLTVDRTLTLSEGVNRIVVSVRNGDGIATSEKVITYQGINPAPVFKDKRIAFVVGNSHYSNSEMNLTNPENDAKDVAEKLKGLGFEVVLKLDATLETMDKELSLFKEKAKDYDVAMFYYAGHGIQNKGVNYIIPTNIDNLAEDNLKYKCVNMERVLDAMEDSQCKLKIVILDACRNDPVSRKWHRSAGTRGLSIMNAPTGTIISFSTSPGSTALDGTGRNSPYTQAFLNTLDMPNLDVFHFFQKVGASVLNMTQKAQNPWLSVSFTGDFYFNKQ